jgi:GntR family transcriptional regulator
VLSDPGGTVIYLAEVTYRGDYVHLDMDLRP